MPASTKSYIYALSCPDSGDVRYIGKANNPQARLKSHIRDSSRRDYPVYRWIRKLIAAGKTLEISVISEHDGDSWKAAEIETISRYRESGARLLNVAIGGDQPECSKEQRAINGRATAKAIHGNTDLHRIWRVKKGAADALRWLEKNSTPERVEKFKEVMRYAAKKRPDIFGKWALI